MKRFKKIMALVIAMAMVLAMALPAMAADTYKIKVTPSGDGANIDGETYSAYKLFDVTYADTDDPADLTNDVFAYSITTDNQFWTDTSAKPILEKYFTFLDTQDPTVKTVLPYGPDASANPAYYQLKNGTFTQTAPTEETKAQYVNDGTQKFAEFDAARAYALTDELNAIEGFVEGLTPTASAQATNDMAEITVPSAGYYLVAGTGHPYEADGTTVDTSKTLMASLALTTTQPIATIEAKIDAPSIDKEIDKDNSGSITDDDTKDDSVKIGDTIPYIVEGAVPKMNGFTTNYFYVVTDTMSKGLTFNNDVAIVIKKVGSGAADLTVPKGSASGTPNVYYTVEYSYDDGVTWVNAPASGALAAKTDAESETKIRIVFHNFVSLKGDLAPQVPGDEVNEGEGVYTNPYAGNTIQITYSATVNDEAVVGTAGNDNTATLTYSRNPNQEGEPKTDNTPGPGPDELDDDVTGETPDSKTKVYVTGLKLFKYTGADKKALAGAKFTLEGDALGQVKEITKTVFVPDAEGTYFLLKDGNYTTKAPTADTTEVIDGTQTTINGTKDKYVAATGSETNKKTVDGVGDFLAFKKTTLTTYDTASATAKKYEVTTDANGIITFTGLDAGVYTLTETEAPKGYNALQAPIYIKVDYTAPNPNDGDHECTWTVAAYQEKACTNKIADLSTTDPNAQLFLEEIENNAGTELPSTGGIGTTIFYVVGAILVLGAGVVLITRRRMDA